MASLNFSKVRGDDRGVSDVLAIAFMFLIVVFAGVLLHGYRFDTISSAANRQLQLKTEYLYRTLELSQVENYSLTYFDGVAENLIRVTPQVVPGNYLRDQIEDVISYLRPPGYAVMVQLSYENSLWEQVYPGDAGVSENSAKFNFAGKVTLIIADAGENRVAQVSAEVTIFKY